jgi:hypothetical protein
VANPAASGLRTVTNKRVSGARHPSWIGPASLLGLYLLSMAHAVLVPHVICEHGELIHTVGQAQYRLTNRAFDSRGVALASATQGVKLTASEADGHCLVCVNSRKLLSESKRDIEPCRPLIDLRRPELVGIAPARLLLLQLAPKHSPPA